MLVGATSYLVEGVLQQCLRPGVGTQYETPRGMAGVVIDIRYFFICQSNISYGV